MPVKDGLWVPLNIAKAICEKGLASEVIPALSRRKALRAAHQSFRVPRIPGPHFETTAVDMMLPRGRTIVLVDDFITSGSTALGCAWRILHTFPGAEVRAFAGCRVLWNGSHVERVYSPVVGTISLQEDGRTLRSP